MKLNFSFLLILILPFHWNSSMAQDTLSLENAIQKSVTSNLSIVLANTNLFIAQNNNTWATSLPTIGIQGSQSNNITTSFLQPFTGPTREGSNLLSTNLNGSALLNWTIFDGFNMFVTKEKMTEIERMGESQLRISIENVIAQTTIAYYNILLQAKMLNQLRESVLISSERKKLITRRVEVGSASSLNLSQAQVDLNADSSAFLRQETAYQNVITDLNRLMGLELTNPVLVSQNIFVNETLQYDELLTKMKAQNASLLLARQEEQAAALSIGQESSNRYPTISLFGGYSYNRNTAAIGFAKLSSNYGPTYGATVAWNLYGGGQTTRAIQNAKLQQKAQEYQRKDLEIQLSSDLLKLFNNYQMNSRLVALEQNNIKVTEATVKIGMEKYRVGMLSDLELRDIQNSYLEASARLLTSIYLAKQSETELLQLTGQLNPAIK